MIVLDPTMPLGHVIGRLRAAGRGRDDNTRAHVGVTWENYKDKEGLDMDEATVARIVREQVRYLLDSYVGAKPLPAAVLGTEGRLRSDISYIVREELRRAGVTPG